MMSTSRVTSSPTLGRVGAAPTRGPRATLCKPCGQRFRANYAACAWEFFELTPDAMAAFAFSLTTPIS